MKSESFEKFYYKKVAMGEGCGCAERIIDVHEINRIASHRREIKPLKRPTSLAEKFENLCRKLGIRKAAL